MTPRLPLQSGRDFFVSVASVLASGQSLCDQGFSVIFLISRGFLILITHDSESEMEASELTEAAVSPVSSSGPFALGGTKKASLTSEEMAICSRIWTVHKGVKIGETQSVLSAPSLSSQSLVFFPLST